MSQQRSRVVFVGNLPFDHTEEQLIEVFSSVGPVVSFRLVFDHGTGKPKGFGFCEYKDPETAASALRNLQGVDVGGRGLRLDFADTEDAPPSKRGAPSGPMGGGGGRGEPRMEGKPLPAGIALAGGVGAVDSISQTLATMPPGQLLDIMSQMKALVTSSPFEARALLTSNPQLSYALFQAMLMMDIVDPAVLQKMLPQSAAPSGNPNSYNPPQQSYNNAPPPAPYSNPNSYNRTPAPSAPQQPPQSNYGQHQGPPQGYGGYPSRPPPQSNYGAPPPQQQPPQQAPADQAALIAQVLSMTQAQIDVLPEESRNTIMQIRAQAAASMGGRR